MPRNNPYKGPDRLTRAAKTAGFPARSVFKLEEIDRRVGLLAPGMSVLDLGACPGSWSLYAAEKVGARGRVLAIDLDPARTAFPPHVTFVEGDALDLDGDALAVGAPYDVVLSDMAPRTTGNRMTDQARSFELFMRALDVAARLARLGGAFVGKIFMSGDLPEARAAVRRVFAKERLIRPEGTRSVSQEIFCIGMGKRAEPLEGA